MKIRLEPSKLLFHEEMLLGIRSITVTSFYINLSFIFIVSRDTPGCWLDVYICIYFLLFWASFWINFGPRHCNTRRLSWLPASRVTEIWWSRLSPRTIQQRTSKWWDFPKTKREFFQGWCCGVIWWFLSLSWYRYPLFLGDVVFLHAKRYAGRCWWSPSLRFPPNPWPFNTTPSHGASEVYHLRSTHDALVAWINQLRLWLRACQ